MQVKDDLLGLTRIAPAWYMLPVVKYCWCLWVRAARSLVFCVVICRSLFVVLPLFVFPIVLSVLRRFVASCWFSLCYLQSPLTELIQYPLFTVAIYPQAQHRGTLYLHDALIFQHPRITNRADLPLTWR